MVAAGGSPDNAGRRGIQGAFAPAPQPVALPNGVVVVPLYDDGIAAVRSTDGGATFSPETTIAPSRFSSSAVRAAPFPSVEVGADGSVLMAWPDCAPARTAPGTTCSSRGRRTGSRGRRRGRSRWGRATTSSTAWPRIPFARGGLRSRTTPSHAGSSTSASRGPWTAAQPGRARSSCPRSACRSAGSRSATGSWSATTSRPRSPADARSPCSRSRSRSCGAACVRATYAASVAVP